MTADSTPQLGEAEREIVNGVLERFLRDKPKDEGDQND
jgi:hypothetical protein